MKRRACLALCLAICTPILAQAGSFYEEVAQSFSTSHAYLDRLAKAKSRLRRVSSAGAPSNVYTQEQPQQRPAASKAPRRQRVSAAPPTTQKGTPISQYGEVNCNLQDIVLPISTAEVASAVQYYYGLVLSPVLPSVRLRVASRIRDIPMADNYRDILGFAERPGFACPRGVPLVTRTAVIATQNMRGVIQRDGQLVTVQAGITLTELVNYANSQQLTIPLGTLAAYLDLTVGGMLSTGAHGQGPTGSSFLADLVTSITFVDGKGQIQTVTSSSPAAQGLLGGVGMLGIITEVTLQLQPGLTKTRVSAIGPKPDDNMEQELLDLIETHSGRMWAIWRPDIKLVKYQLFEEVPATEPSVPPETPDLPTIGGALKPQPDEYWKAFYQVAAAITLNLPDKEFAESICPMVAAVVVGDKYAVQGYGPQPEGAFLDSAVGLTNNMQGTDCNVPGTVAAATTGSCAFDPRVIKRINEAEAASNIPAEQRTPPVTFEEAEFALPQTHIASFISDVKTLALASNTLNGTCWGPSTFFIRPTGASPGLISPASGSASDKFVWVDYAMFRPNVRLPVPPELGQFTPRLQKRLPGVQEAVEQLMACKYGARPHWGKVWSRVFGSAACPIRNLYPQWDQQMQLAAAYDPAKLFQTSLLSTVIAGGQPASPLLLPACTNEMTCYCQTDMHCGLPGIDQPLSCKTLPPPLPPFKVCLP